MSRMSRQCNHFYAFILKVILDSLGLNFDFQLCSDVTLTLTKIPEMTLHIFLQCEILLHWLQAKLYITVNKPNAETKNEFSHTEKQN